MTKGCKKVRREEGKKEYIKKKEKREAESKRRKVSKIRIK